jgi:aryl-alcohol dehydrogenase-like predicted oxidoreductase
MNPEILWPRPLGRSGIVVSCVGLGTGDFGHGGFGDDDARRMLGRARALGLNVIDTARSYGESEARIGRALVGQRDPFVVISKGGYGVEGAADWTPDAVARGIDRALSTLGIERLDVFMLHSCERWRLLAGDLFAPLLAAKRAGKVRAIGYSGDGPALDAAIDATADATADTAADTAADATRGGGAATPVFDVVECSVNLVDQAALASAIPRAVARGIGVIAKRPLANAAYRWKERPPRADVAEYWERSRTVFGERRDLTETAIRFAAHAPGVGCAVVGTTKTQHLEAAARAAAKGQAPDAESMREKYLAVGARWDGMV